MKLKQLLVFFVFIMSSFTLHAGLWDSVTGCFKGEESKVPSSVRVLLVHDVPSVNLEVVGTYCLFDPYANVYLSSRFTGKNRPIQALCDGLKWGESFPGLYQLKIQPKSKTTFIVVDKKEYEGSMYVYDVGGTVSLVNEISAENYVREILGNYQSMGLEKETLSALAIVIRTNAYFQAANPKNDFWTVDAQKVSFLGLVPPCPAIDKAANETRYMVMSRTGIYERTATPFSVQFGTFSGGQITKDTVISKISLEEANALAKSGQHAAQILATAFPGSVIMLMKGVE